MQQAVSGEPLDTRQGDLIETPILEAGNVTVLADLWRGSSNYHLLGAFCTSQSHSLPTSGAQAYIISNMVAHHWKASQAPSTAKPTQDSPYSTTCYLILSNCHLIGPHIQPVIDSTLDSWQLPGNYNFHSKGSTNSLLNFSKKHLFYLSL